MTIITNPRKDWFNRIRTTFNAFSDVSFSTYHRERILPLLKNKKTTPRIKDVYKAFDLVPFEKVRVVILGQDPYYQVLGKETYATGLAFALNPKILKTGKLKTLKGGKSLRTILKAVGTELGKKVSDTPTTDLESWAKEGVLLLNTALTTRYNTPKAHLNAWKGFIASVILALNAKTESIYYVLTCESAKAVAPLIRPPHKVLFNYKHPSRCWRVSSRLKEKKAEINFFKTTQRNLGINWGRVLK